MAYEYPEETLIGNFMPDFKRDRNYVEKFEDTDTSGSDPIDSAGFIGKQVVLIEFKDTVRPKEVRYEGSQGSSIEKKISTVLSNLYNRRNDRVTTSLGLQNIRREPLFILVVNRLNSRVLELLKRMLVERGATWHFGYEIIEWRNNRPLTLFYSAPKDVPEGRLSSVTFPSMPSTAPKRMERMTAENCRSILDQAGLGSQWHAMHEELQKLRAKPKSGPKNNLNYCFPKQTSRAAIGFWPSDSNAEKGLLVSYRLPVLQQVFGSPIVEQSLPGLPGPRKGHLGATRYLQSEGDIKKFWNIIADTSDR